MRGWGPHIPTLWGHRLGTRMREVLGFRKASLGHTVPEMAGVPVPQTPSPHPTSALGSLSPLTQISDEWPPPS